ncbi:ABC transporter transmembrane domain-containing protein, partial [Novosphingobium sp.]|uniref:ABC transporter transmembrane domain-containing protein n=2 Tax=Novosphingobium TaxID=165696 RepID=UPI0035673958
MDEELKPAEPARARTLGPLRMIWREAIKYPGRLAAASGALLVTSGATLAIPAGFRLIIDKGFAAGANVDELGRWFQYLLLIVLVLAIGTACRFYFVSWLGERVVADIRLRVQGNLLRLPPSFFESNSPKEISSRMTSDTAIIEQVVGTTVSVALRNTITAIGGLIYLFYLAPKLTAILLVGIPLVVLPIVVIGRRVRNVSRSSQDRVAGIGVIVAEVLGAMKIVQAFGQEQRELGRFAEKVEATFETALRRISLRAGMTAIVILLIFGGITMLVWEGALGVAQGTISGGTIFAIVITAGLVAGAAGSLSEVYGDLLRGAGAAGRLNELLREEPDIAP